MRWQENSVSTRRGVTADSAREIARALAERLGSAW